MCEFIPSHVPEENYYFIFSSPSFREDSSFSLLSAHNSAAAALALAALDVTHAG